MAVHAADLGGVINRSQQEAIEFSFYRCCGTQHERLANNHPRALRGDDSSVKGTAISR
jgi:hypothetical protein